MSLATMGRFPSVLPGWSDSPLPDGQLLQRYVATRDEQAFAGLVERYGPPVLGACKRVLQHSHHAARASHARFLLLPPRAAMLGRLAPLFNSRYLLAFRASPNA